ncbi:MAG: hypothetical protein E6H93_03115 [Chloroflexi bacterium]|nr:MAG: hypothetical protein E6H93_03115 [Chloroflexota bacterium]
MIVYLPAVLFAVGLLVVYGSAGRRRQAGTFAMAVAAAWSLALLVDPSATAWAIGPLAAILLLSRPAQRVPSSFEGLTRRGVTIAASMLVALFLASRLPIGENPVLLSAVPWLLSAVGVAWLVSPADQPERLQGQVLMIAGAAGVILCAVNAGPLTAGVAGALALMPIAGERARVPGRLRPAISGLLLLLAAVAIALAATAPSFARVTLFDLSLNLTGPVLLAIAVVLVAGVVVTPLGSEWVALLGVLALIATAPSLRWAALAALVAVATVLERHGERPAWIAAGLLGLMPVLAALGTSSWSPRVQAVGLALGLVLMLFAAGTGFLRVLALPATTFLVMLAVGSLSTGQLVRFQWIAAVGAILLSCRALISMVIRDSRRDPLRDPLIMGLLLLAIAARDSLGLGDLAVVLLLVDLVLVRIDEAPPRRPGWAGRMVELARSSWPPAVTFAAAAMAVVADLQASLVLGLLAALSWAGLQLAPLVDRHALVPAPERPRTALRWIGPALSIACGVAPALLLRMLRLGG